MSQPKAVSHNDGHLEIRFTIVGPTYVCLATGRIELVWSERLENPRDH